MNAEPNTIWLNAELDTMLSNEFGTSSSRSNAERLYYEGKINLHSTSRVYQLLGSSVNQMKQGKIKIIFGHGSRRLNARTCLSCSLNMPVAIGALQQLECPEDFKGVRRLCRL